MATKIFCLSTTKFGVCYTRYFRSFQVSTVGYYPILAVSTCSIQSLLNQTPPSLQTFRSLCQTFAFCIKEYSTTASKAPKVDKKNIDIQVYGIEDESLGIMKQWKAEQLAKERNLKLARVDSPADSLPRFRLMAPKQFKEELMKVKVMQRPEKGKSISISGKISAHDLNVKKSHILEWLGKGLVVRVSIRNADKQLGDGKIFDDIVSACRDMATVQTAKKTETEVSFQLLPINSAAGGSGDGPSKDTEKQKPFKLDELKRLRQNPQSDGNAS